MPSKLAGNSAEDIPWGRTRINALMPAAIGGDTQLAAIPAGAISSTNIPGLAGTQPRETTRGCGNC